MREMVERSLNIDLALGLLRMAIDKRPDLRVIISSATIRAETFQKYFSRKGDGSDVPLISIQARTYPVEITYRDVEGHDRDGEGERRAFRRRRRARPLDSGRLPRLRPPRAAAGIVIVGATGTDSTVTLPSPDSIAGSASRKSRHFHSPAPRKDVSMVNARRSSPLIPATYHVRPFLRATTANFPISP